MNNKQRAAEFQVLSKQIGADTLHGTPEALAAFLKVEITKWDKILRAAGVRLD